MVEKDHDFQIGDLPQFAKPTHPVVLTIRQLAGDGDGVLVYLNSHQNDDEAQRAAKEWARRI